jgi:hypothetical protein
MAQASFIEDAKNFPGLRRGVDDLYNYELRDQPPGHVLSLYRFYHRRGGVIPCVGSVFQ